MTFDELWRLDWAQQNAPLESIEETDKVDLFDRSALADWGPDDPKTEEVTRFIQWLEESLSSCDSEDG